MPRPRSGSRHRAPWVSSPCSRSRRSWLETSPRLQFRGQSRASRRSEEPHHQARMDSSDRAIRRDLEPQVVKERNPLPRPRLNASDPRPGNLEHRTHRHAGGATEKRIVARRVTRTASTPSAAAERKIAPMLVEFPISSSTATRRAPRLSSSSVAFGNDGRSNTASALLTTSYPVISLKSAFGAT